MEQEKISIPEEIQQICREFAEVAIKHNLYRVSGTFSPRINWGGEITFNWENGRHEQNELRISTQLFVNTAVKMC